MPTRHLRYIATFVVVAIIATSAISRPLAATATEPSIVESPAPSASLAIDNEVVSQTGDPSMPPSTGTPGAGYDWQQYLYYTAGTGAFFTGSFFKDWGEGKTWKRGWNGKRGNQRYSDMKKYGTLFAGSLALGLIAMAIPDPMQQFRLDLIASLDEAIARLDELIQQSGDILLLTEELSDAVTGLTFNILGDLFSDTANSIKPYVDRYDELMGRAARLPVGESDPQLETDIDGFFDGVYTNVRGQYENAKSQSMFQIAEDAMRLAQQLPTDAEGESLYYEALWAMASYADGVVGQAASLMHEFHMYQAYKYPDYQADFLREAQFVVDDYRTYQATMMAMIRLPAGSDGAGVEYGRTGWVIQADDGWDPRFGWYDCGCGLQAVSIEDDEFNPYGRPSSVSPIVHVSAVGDPDHGAMWLYHDGRPVGEIDSGEGFMPGPNVSKVVLTADEEEIPTEGWAVFAEPADGYGFMGWGGDAAPGVRTTEVEPTLEDWTFVTASFVDVWSTVDVTVTGPGQVEVWEYGQIVATVTAEDTADGEPVWFVGETSDIEVVLTEDREVVEDENLAMVVLFTDGELVEWSPELGTGEHAVALAGGGELVLDVVASNGVAEASAQPSPVTTPEANAEVSVIADVTELAIVNDGPGIVEVHEDGQLIATIGCYSIEFVAVSGSHSSITRVTERSDIGSGGLYLLSTADDSGFAGTAKTVGWSGETVAGDVADVVPSALTVLTVEHAVEPRAAELDLNASRFDGEAFGDCAEGDPTTSFGPPGGELSGVKHFLDLGLFGCWPSAYVDIEELRWVLDEDNQVVRVDHTMTIHSAGDDFAITEVNSPGFDPATQSITFDVVVTGGYLISLVIDLV